MGVVRPTPDASVYIGGAVGYTALLTDELIRATDESPIVRAQEADPTVNVLTGLPFEGVADQQKAEAARDALGLGAMASFLAGLGDDDLAVLYDEYLITYADYVGLLTGSLTSMVNAVSAVLIAFVAVSLLVSCIMIGIITHISVLERTKEIGILRALGASRHNISQVFNAETVIVGLLAGPVAFAHRAHQRRFSNVPRSRRVCSLAASHGLDRPRGHQRGHYGSRRPDSRTQGRQERPRGRAALRIASPGWARPCEPGVGHGLARLHLERLAAQ